MSAPTDRPPPDLAALRALLERPPALRRVRPVHLEAATRKIPHQPATPTLHPSTVALVEQRLARPDGAGGDWSRAQLRAACQLLTHRALAPAALTVIERHTSTLPTGVLPTALAYAPGSGALRRHAARLASAGTLRGPAWLRCQTPASLQTPNHMAHQIASQLGHDAPVPTLAERMDLQVGLPLTSKALRLWLRQAPSEAVWRHAKGNVEWALPLAADAAAAREVLDVLLAHADAHGLGLQHPVLAGMFTGLSRAYRGWPRDRRALGRWEKHAPQMQQLAHRYHIGNQLEGFFADLYGDPDRLAYWRRWLDRIDEAKHYPQVNAFSMHIGDHVVVEFGAIGNAAYVYRAEHWTRHFRPDRARHERDLKDRALAAARLLHSGSWQHKADRAMHTLTRLSPKP